MNRHRVLIVDDERGVRESLRMVLKERADVILASSGEEALRLLQSDRVDVILLDILMPDLDGLDVLERIKELEHSPQVIMLTATKTVKTAVRAMKLGAFDYITKPFDIDELLLIVDRAVQSQSLVHEVESLRAELGIQDLPGHLVGSDSSRPGVTPSGTPLPRTPMSEAVDQLECRMILSALAEAGHNQTRAAEILGTTRRILKYKMDKLGIPFAESAGD